MPGTATSGMPWYSSPRQKPGANDSATTATTPALRIAIIAG